MPLFAQEQYGARAVPSVATVPVGPADPINREKGIDKTHVHFCNNTQLNYKAQIKCKALRKALGALTFGAPLECYLGLGEWTPQTACS